MEFDVKEIAKWIEQSVKDMQETDWSGCWYKLDNGLGICIYWCDGWGDEPRDDVIQDKEHPDYGLVCGIKLIDENDQSGGGPYFWKFPYFENGEVATEDTGILPNENFEELAKQMLADFNSVKDLEIDEDGLIHKGEPAPESSEEGEEIPAEEGCKKPTKKSLKEDIHGGDVIDDLVDRAQSMLNDRGYGDAEDCVRQAIDDGLIYTADVLALLEYYGSIDDSTIIESYYEDLFSEVLDRLEEPEEEEEEDELEDDYEPEESHWDGDLEDEEDDK